MKRRHLSFLSILVLFISATASGKDTIYDYAQKMLQEGRQIFRYDTFGSEAFWGDALKPAR
jgi:hypothetical protein